MFLNALYHKLSILIFSGRSICICTSLVELTAMVGTNQGEGLAFQQISMFWRLGISSCGSYQQTHKTKKFGLVRVSVCSDFTPNNDFRITLYNYKMFSFGQPKVECIQIMQVYLQSLLY